VDRWLDRYGRLSLSALEEPKRGADRSRGYRRGRPSNRVPGPVNEDQIVAEVRLVQANSQ
jgi:hypothetical protein